jgi:hypothetical protein
MSSSALSTSICVTALIHAATGGGTLYYVMKWPLRSLSVFVFIPIDCRNNGIGYESLVPCSCHLFCSSSNLSISDGVVNLSMCVLGWPRPLLSVWIQFQVLLSSGGSTLSVWCVFCV